MQLTKGMTAIVTGGVSGLGEASAIALLERGLNVVAVDLNEERGAAMEQHYAGQLKFIKADVADGEQMQAVESSFYDDHSWDGRSDRSVERGRGGRIRRIRQGAAGS